MKRDKGGINAGTRKERRKEEGRIDIKKEGRKEQRRREGRWERNKEGRKKDPSTLGHTHFRSKYKYRHRHRITPLVSMFPDVQKECQ